MPAVDVRDVHMDDVAYRVRVLIVAQVIDRTTGEVIASGDEDDMKELYRFLKKREPKEAR